ncbi:unnamed protein product [Closterium sp. NIES-53]
MGQSGSREELIRHAAKHGDTSGIRELVSRGISVNCVDSKGRTPLILASSRAEGYEAAKLLLQMGAHVHAYCKGPGGGTAIHHATRKQLDATVKLLLDHGADPLLPNDERKSALDLARATAVVRLIESRVALFEGYVRLQTLSAPSLVKAFIPQWVYRRIWVAVLPEPTMSDGRQTFRLKLYPSMAFGTPYFTIALHVCRIHLTKLDSANPVLVIEDPVHAEKGKWKFVSDKDSTDPSQIFRLHDACRGTPRARTQSANQHPTLQHVASSPRTPHSHAPPPATQLPASRSHTAPSSIHHPPPQHMHPPMYPHPPAAPAVSPFAASAAAAAYDAYAAAYYTQQQAQHQQQAWQQYQQQQQQQQQGGGCSGAAAGAGGMASGSSESRGVVNVHAWQDDVDEDTAFQLALSESMHTASTASSARADAPGPSGTAAAAAAEGMSRGEEGAGGLILTRSSSEPQSRSGRSLSSSSSSAAGVGAAATDAFTASHRSSRSVSASADRHPFAPPAAPIPSSSGAAGSSSGIAAGPAAGSAAGSAGTAGTAAAAGVEGGRMRDEIANQFSSVAPAFNRAAAAVSSLFASGPPSAPPVDGPASTSGASAGAGSLPGAAVTGQPAAAAAAAAAAPAAPAGAAPAFNARAAVAAEAIATAAGALTSATAAAAATAWQRTTGHRASFFDPPLIQFSPPSSPRRNPNPHIHPQAQPPNSHPHTPANVPSAAAAFVAYPASLPSPGAASVAELHPSYNPERVQAELARAQSQGRGAAGAAVAGGRAAGTATGAGAGSAAAGGAGAEAGAEAGAGAGVATTGGAPASSSTAGGAPASSSTAGGASREGQCVICWDSAAHAVCVPCGHVAGCVECLAEVRSKGWGCPVCRAPIREVVKIFHV